MKVLDNGPKVSGYNIFLGIAIASAVIVSGLQIYTVTGRTSLAAGSVQMDKGIPYDLKYEDAMIGQARLVAEKGFMHMDLWQLIHYFHAEVSYQPDIYAYQSWKLPSLFAAERGGDCEDYVLFALAVLDHSFYDLRPMVGTFDGVGHAFLLVNDTQHEWLVDCIQAKVVAGGELPSEYHADMTFSDMLEGVYV